MRLHANSFHSHEQGLVKPVSKINLKIFVYHVVQSDLPWSLKSNRYWSNEMEATTQESCVYKVMSSSLQYNTPMVQVYIMWINELRSNTMRHRLITVHWGIPLKNARQPTNDESRYQGTEYISTNVNEGAGVEHLKDPLIRRHWCIPICQWWESLPLMTASLKVLIKL